MPEAPLDPELLDILRCPVAVHYEDRGDDPGRLELMADIWTASAQPWDELSPTLPQFETTPTPEELQELATH